MFFLTGVPYLGTVFLPGTVLVWMYVLFKRNTSVFKNNGIPGPSPVPLFGNLLLTMKLGMKADKVFLEKYGKVYGTYIGAFPLVNVFDLDILRQITVKEFNNFPDRLVNIGKNADTIGKGVFFLEGSDWRRVRNIITPAFSSGKLKLMTDIMNRKAITLTDNMKIKATGNDVVDVREVYGAFTTDVIAATAFGLDLDSQNTPDDPFVKMSKLLFERMQIETPLFVVFLIFPFLAKLLGLFRVSIFPKESLDFFKKFGNELIVTRRSSKSSDSCDFIQFLMDAEDSSTENKTLTVEEILGQILLFFAAGYETTSNLLQYTSYLLATNQHVQQKLAEEVADVEVTYESVTNLPYLDQVLCEALRMYPPVPQVSRNIEKAMVINGIHFPKNAFIIIPIFHIHHNAEYYPEPEVFKPERFTREGKSNMHPLQYLPFGYGPRNCVGMRLALLETKIALLRILKEVKFEVCSDTVVPLEVREAATLRPNKPIKLKVVPRN